MKAHIGVDANSSLVHAVVGTAANIHDVTQADKLLHGQEVDVSADRAIKALPIAWFINLSS